MKQNIGLSTYVYALITVVLWSSAYVFTRIAVIHFTPEAISCSRYFIASLVLLIYAMIKKIRLPKLKDIPIFFIAGASGFSFYVYFFNLGSQTVTASASSFIISISPVITALLAGIFYKEKIGYLKWIYILFALAGVAVISFGGNTFSMQMGAIWVFIAAILISIYNIFQKRLLVDYSPIEATSYCIFSGTILLAIFIPEALPQIQTASTAQILILIYLGVFPGSIAYVCWAYALSKAENTSEVTNFMFMTPIITTFMGYIMISEAPSILTYVGGGFTLFGVLMVTISKKPACKAD